MCFVVNHTCVDSLHCAEVLSLGEPKTAKHKHL
jgi:hypothetical protein